MDIVTHGGAVAAQSGFSQREMSLSHLFLGESSHGDIY